MKKPIIKHIKDDSGRSAADHNTNDVRPTLSGTAAAHARVDIFDNGRLIGTVRADDDGKWSFTCNKLRDGAHNFIARAELDGAIARSPLVKLTVDSTPPPAPALDLAGASDSGASANDSVTNQTMPILAGTAERGATITIRDGLTVLGSAVADGSGKWSFATPTLGDGIHGITAVASDKAGNVSAVSRPLNVIIDTVAPAAPSTPDLDAASDSGPSAADNITGDATPILTGMAEPGSAITIRDGVTVLGTVTADVSGNWGFFTGSLIDGVHNLTATATDLAGNESAASAALSVVIDTAAPAAPSTPDLAAGSDSGASASDSLTNDSMPTLNGTAEPGAVITIRDGGTVLGTTIADGAGAWSFTADILSDGGHSITATATDAAGNVGAASGPLAVIIDTAAPAAPSPDLDAGSDSGMSASDNITNDDTPTLGGTTEPGVVIALRDGGTALGTATANGSGAWSFTTGELSEGAHSITATATDPAGNVSAAAGPLAITIDTVIPAAPSAPDLDAGSDSGASETDNLTNDTTPTFTGTAAAGSTVTLKEGSTVLGTAVATGGGIWTITSSALGDGGHIVGATATDAAGNESAASPGLSVTIELDIDASAMSAAQGFRIFGADSDDWAGFSVSSAGDINGDGFDDLIVGAWPADGPLDDRNYAGEAIVVFGKSTGFAAIDASTMTEAQGFRIFGADSGDRAGFSVSSAGDINGDGFDDLIVGAEYGDGLADDRRDAGEAIVVFGKATGLVDIDVSAPAFATQGFRIFGADPYDVARSVSSAGDINGDGFDDLIVGARYADGPTTGRTNAGEAIVVFGKAAGFGNVDVATMAAADGFRIFGAEMEDQAGFSVSSAGDINGDGFDDVIVGARRGNGPADDRNFAGEAIVVFGKATGFDNVDVATMGVADGFRIFGADELDQTGFSVSSAGDINGDGFDDLIVGAPNGDGPADDRDFAGEAIVVFGKATGLADIDVSLMTPLQGFRIFGADSQDYAGWSVASAGDINGDGFDDLIVGAYRGDGPTESETSAGEAIVVFGKASGLADIDVVTMTSAQGFRIFGVDSGDHAGWSVSSAGDINGDGFDDLIVGARQGDGPTNGESNAGEAIVVFGGDFLGTVVFAGTNGADTLTGTSAAETFVGGQGTDAMIGNGGADAFHGGAGGDAITVPDLAFRLVDGGSGTDRLVFAGSSQTLNLATFADNRITGIEALDVTGSGNDTLVVGALDAFHFSDTPNAAFTGAASHANLVVFGDAGDTLQLDDFDPDGVDPSPPYTWQLAESDQNLDGSDGGGFDFWNLLRNSIVLASIAVDADMTVA